MRTALHLLLLVFLALFLPACSTDSTKRDLPPSVEILPPRVDCNQPSANDPPMHPTTADPEAWAIWAAAAYLTIGQERELDTIEEDCIQKLKAEKIIR